MKKSILIIFSAAVCVATSHAATTKLECTYIDKKGQEESQMAEIDFDEKILYYNDRKYTVSGHVCDPEWEGRPICVLEKINDDEIKFQFETKGGVGIWGGTIYRKTGKLYKWHFRVSDGGRNSWNGSCKKLTDNKF